MALHLDLGFRWHDGKTKVFTHYLWESEEREAGTRISRIRSFALQWHLPWSASSSCTPPYTAAITSQWTLQLLVHQRTPPIKKESPGTGEMAQRLHMLATLADDQDSSPALTSSGSQPASGEPMNSGLWRHTHAHAAHKPMQACTYLHMHMKFLIKKVETSKSSHLRILLHWKQIGIWIIVQTHTINRSIIFSKPKATFGDIQTND